MGELAESVLDAGGEVTGVEPQFFIDLGYKYDRITRLIVTQGMSERKAKMIELGEAFIAFPGGTGTLEELAEAISQRRLRIHENPCICYNVDGFYDMMKPVFARMVEDDFCPKEDVSLIHYAADVNEIAEILSRIG